MGIYFLLFTQLLLHKIYEKSMKKQLYLMFTCILQDLKLLFSDLPDRIKYQQFRYIVVI